MLLSPFTEGADLLAAVHIPYLERLVKRAADSEL
jgi:hypothetical protein